MNRLSMIAALSRNFAIGLDNRLLWHISEDLVNFKALTMGKPMIMGRKTFDSIGRPLPGRANIVVSRDTQWQAEGVQVARSVDAAINAAHRACEDGGQDEIMVIGGEQIYRQALPSATRLYLTEVDVEMAADRDEIPHPNNINAFIIKSVPIETASTSTNIIAPLRIR